MNALISQALNLQNKLGLPEESLVDIQEAMRTYAVGALNAAKHPIEKREEPDVIRKFMSPIGLTYSGKTKTFS